ncbi:hypothetical protein PIB30_087355 [Stylosanthes scabra]|uniref:Uncharacterized protein n=1 Tax=Stylosanthes scabra TaxID=79078 RepID=A0ABU6QU25_9FABA|nr:hypothetical protein [Stylosanthes scabra]
MIPLASVRRYLQRNSSFPDQPRARHQILGAVVGEAEISHSDPGWLLFGLKIERTLRRARQARRRAELARLASDNILFDWFDSDSDSDTQTTSSDIGTFIMGERLTLKQIGGGKHCV